MDDDLRELRWKVVRRVNELHKRNGLPMRRAVAVALKENGLTSLEQIFSSARAGADGVTTAQRFEDAQQLSLPLVGLDDETLRALPPCSPSVH